MPQATSAANPVLHDISRVTLSSCPGQQFHLNKQGRKYRKYYSSEQEGKTHTTKEILSKGATAFPTPAYRHSLHRETAGKDTRSSFPRSAECWCLDRTAHSPREGCMSHPELVEERSQDPCSKSSHIWPSQGFSNLFLVALLSTSPLPSGKGTSQCHSYTKASQGSPNV